MCFVYFIFRVNLVCPWAPASKALSSAQTSIDLQYFDAPNRLKMTPLLVYKTTSSLNSTCNEENMPYRLQKHLFYFRNIYERESDCHIKYISMDSKRYIRCLIWIQKYIDACLWFIKGTANLYTYSLYANFYKSSYCENTNSSKYLYKTVERNIWVIVGRYNTHIHLQMHIDFLWITISH